MSQTTPLHYSTHAATVLGDIAKQFHRSFLGYDQLEELLVQWLNRAVVFQLPDNGLLFSDRDFRPELTDLIRLPYPMIAVEFHADDHLFREESGLARADKRIALAFSPCELPPREKAILAAATGTADWLDEDPAAVAVLALYAPNTPPDPRLAWGFAAGLVLWEPASHIPIPTKEVVKPEMPAWAEPRHQSDHSLPVTLLPFKQRMALLNISPNDGLNSILNDSTDELGAVWDLLSALNCKNVSVHSEAAPAPLNKKRLKAGKLPFKDTHFLDITLNTEAAGGRSSGSGAHASPRVHLRRGHIRHLPATDTREARNIWINATTVGTGTPRARPYRIKVGSTERPAKIMP